MATGYTEKLTQKIAGICSDVSSSTDSNTARVDAIETAGQIVRTSLTFSCAETTAAAAASSLRLPVPANGNWAVKSAVAVLESGALAAAGYTNYMTVTVSKSADGTATKTTVASWDTQTDTLALGGVKSLTLTGANVLLAGGSLVADVAKTGAGQTAGVTNVTVELQRRSD